jgi:hypothetical protein
MVATPTNQDEGFFPTMRLAKRPDYTAARNAAITEGIHTTLQFPLLCAIVCKLTTPIYSGLVRLPLMLFGWRRRYAPADAQRKVVCAWSWTALILTFCHSQET